MQNFINVLLFILLSTSINSTQERVGGTESENLENAYDAIRMILEKDPGLKTFFDISYGYAVFPSVGKGAVGISGVHGSGTVFEQGDPVGKTTLTQSTIGFQFGGRYYSEIIFFEDEETFDLFKSSKLELAAQAFALAVASGVSSDLAYKDGVAIITIEKGGLKYEATVGGQKFGFEAVDNFEEEQSYIQNDSGY